jgi:anti-anti-sigma regulatory factor
VDEDTNRGLSIGSRWTGGGTLLVELSGYLDSSAMTSFAICANDVCGTPARSVHIGLTGVTSADYAGLRALATFCRILQRQGCGLVLVGPQALVRDLLDRLCLAMAGGEEDLAAAPRPGREPASPVVPLSAGEQQALQLVEGQLAAEEPALAAMFASFGRSASD